ncbi:MAG: (1-_4)-alpha-D-glucan 1-alpha-D-glucosylmutase [Elusimicrobia bacterium]|nr:MAG: (1->4)-alpha-D-glucan 1-alpha-D-glucosylmutase [Elusimicrobiota bacterium]KAF0154897.1 MAG: (1->4)-alpha-D-glucan 1-alpha-D-glucosylmutase [Elusimicrobiota bacterium]
MNAPLAAYRLQLHKGFPFARAAELVPYLKELGVSHLYASPVFKARAGSLHGYDVTDPAVINPELGGGEGLASLSEELKRSGLSIMQDIVPNHMSYDSQNEMLMDVMEKGPYSRYKSFFDIDWEHIYENLRGRILTPFLGSFYGEALENGELRLVYDERGLALSYYALRLPLRVESYAEVFGGDIAPLEAALGPDSPELARYIGTAGLFRGLKSEDPAAGGQCAHARRMLRELYSSSEAVRAHADAAVERFNGRKGDSASFDALDALVSSQFFRPSYWKVAAEEINYRRFFTINELISVRVEDPEVFTRVHAATLGLTGSGAVTALRVDHVDGLLDPQGYLVRLREAAGAETYIVVEKILAPGEELAPAWPIEGTTGYDFTNYANGLFCRRESDKEFSRLYYRFTGLESRYDEMVVAKKRMMISRHLAGNIDNLAHMMKKSAADDRYGRDITLYGLRRALVEVMANFPVYRTYVNGPGGPTEAERAVIKTAVEGARRRLRDFGYELNFIEAFLLMGGHKSLEGESAGNILPCVMAFQQYTAPLMAKGFEDTILYIYNRLASLNEVGGSPDRFGFSPEEVHAFFAGRAARAPLTMNCTSTHDTKRSEDVRARINVLSETPAEWYAVLRRWAKLLQAGRRKDAAGREMPSLNDEYLLYQTLLGAWPSEGEPMPDFAERIREYSVKAAREAQVDTNWIKPDEEYEAALRGFIDRALQPGPENKFLGDFLPSQRLVAFYGAFNSLSQALLKLAAPGLPDIYQGCELWDFSLVDPDNRRPVDFALRSRLLAELKRDFAADPASLMAGLLADLPSGRIKLFLTWRALAARAAMKGVFEGGSYLPLAAEGPRAESVFAFARVRGGSAVIAAVPRLLSGFVPAGQPPLGELWQDTRLILPPELRGTFTDSFSGRTFEAGEAVALKDLFSSFPCALLTRG